MDNSVLNWRFVFRVGGFILLLESLFMFLSLIVARYFQGTDAAALLQSGVITLATGLLLLLPTDIRTPIRLIGKREGYITVSVSWLLFALFGALPFFLSGEIPSFTNAFFESASGITTTGATVLTDIESMSKGLLFWRSLLQWLGGMGIVVFSLALMPLLGGEAAQLFDAEASGVLPDKFRPRFSQVAKRLWAIYMGLTILLFLLLLLGPMDWFDSICHSFTTISTGGYSTRQQSIAFWDSSYIEILLMVFMVIGAINFSLLYFLFKGNFRKFFKDEELRWYLGIIISAGVLITLALSWDHYYDFLPETIRHAFFQVISAFTTTGFFSDDYVLWGPFYWIVILLLMIICGCAGSTSGGLKTVRAVILIKNTFAEFNRLIHPRAVIPVRLNDRALSFGVVQRLLAFAFLYIIIIFFSWGILTLCGIPVMDALCGAITSLSNIGYGLGETGPSGSFMNISSFAKWYMSLLMIVGRLEIFTVLILFTPGFWKR